MGRRPPQGAERTNQWLESRAGLEPAYAALQTAASPLRHLDETGWGTNVIRHPEVPAKRASKDDGPGRSFEARYARTSG